MEVFVGFMIWAGMLFVALSWLNFVDCGGGEWMERKWKEWFGDDE